MTNQFGKTHKGRRNGKNNSCDKVMVKYERRKDYLKNRR